MEIADIGPAVQPLEAELSALEPVDAAARLQWLIRTAGASVLAHEADMRRALWVYQDTWLRSSGAEPPALR
ncbi:MAG: hypothetical protein ACYTGN_02835, partial [Planctomycetota bacterium]